MKNKSSIILLAISLLAAPTYSQSDAQALNIIRSKAVTINSIDWENTDYSDLEKLIPILKDVKVLGLGEINHDDGATFKAKLRLVKFLHEKMGFEVLAFESSFYGGVLANAEMDKENTNFQFANGNLPGWFHSKYVYPLLQYAKDTRKTASPLLLGGFEYEKQPNAVANGLALMRQIYKVVDWVTIDTLMKSKIDSFIKGVQGSLGNSYLPAIENNRVRTDATNQLKKLLQEIEISQERLSLKLNANEYLLIKLALRSLLMTNETKGDGSTGMAWNVFRDNFMAKRVQWLTDSLYPGKKVILWAATGHLIRNIISIDRQNPPEYDMLNIYPYYQLGDYLYQLYGDKYYCMAFTCYKGETGLLYPDMPNYKQYEYTKQVPVIDTGSFEELFHRLNKPYLFFDLRNNKSPFITANRKAHPLGFRKDLTNWSKIVDAFFFIDTMEPDVNVKMGK
jgi:erythromycin esterase